MPHCQCCRTIKNLLPSPNRRYRKKDGSIGTTHICRFCNAERNRRYRSTAQGKQKIKELQVRQRNKFPNKEKARGLLNYQIKMGRVIKPATCSSCGSRGVLDGHHEDYNKPLSVVWLCRICHTKSQDS